MGLPSRATTALTIAAVSMSAASVGVGWDALRSHMVDLGAAVRSAVEPSDDAHVIVERDDRYDASLTVTGLGHYGAVVKPTLGPFGHATDPVEPLRQAAVGSDVPASDADPAAVEPRGDVVRQGTWTDGQDGPVSQPSAPAVPPEQQDGLWPSSSDRPVLAESRPTGHIPEPGPTRSPNRPAAPSQPRPTDGPATPSQPRPTEEPAEPSRPPVLPEKAQPSARPSSRAPAPAAENVGRDSAHRTDPPAGRDNSRHAQGRPMLRSPRPQSDARSRRVGTRPATGRPAGPLARRPSSRISRRRPPVGTPINCRIRRVGSLFRALSGSISRPA
jgi:hypothetical protein